MKRLELTRYVDDGQATLGRLRLIENHSEPWYTIERPWRENQRNVSCIPLGTYLIVPRHYHRGGYPAWEVEDVPDRSMILFHIANWAHDVEGCIGIGMGASPHSNGFMVTDSVDGFRSFMGAMGDRDDAEPAVLVVTGV